MKWLIKILKLIVTFSFVSLLAAVGILFSAYLYLEPDLPSIDHLRDIRLQVPLRVFSRDQKLIAEFGEKRRIPLAYDDIPETVIQAFLAAEDDRFFEHPGVDYQGILRAATQLVLTGERRQGGSTITMQVARNFFLSREKTFTRKLNEIFLAFRIEQQLTKREILELYLNKIYLGNRAYGIGAASQVYYGLPVENLNLAQIAMIAGLPKAPSRFNPIADPERALLRRNYVLGRMEQVGYITPEMMQEALASPVSAEIYGTKVESEAPYVAEMVRSEMVERYGNEAYTAGYKVYTTIDSHMQHTAVTALRGALQEYDQRHGYRGPILHRELSDESDETTWKDLLTDAAAVGDLLPGLVIGVEEKSAGVLLADGNSIEIPWGGLEWAKPYIDENRRGAAPKAAADILKRGDVIHVLETEDKDEKRYWRLAQLPAAAGALVALDPDDGSVRALVGGYDFYESKFNRVTQAKRQPGSGFKAFIYSAALEAGFTPASIINDAPVVFDDPGLEAAWRPENYSGKFFGPTRLREALTHSRNLVSIRLLRSMGTKHALGHISQFGFNPQELPQNLSLALGSGAVTPMQMAQGYAVLANGGYRVEPYFIEQIIDERDDIVFEATPLRVCDDCEASGQPAQEAANEAEEEPQPRIAQRVITPANHYLMNSMMRDVIRSGTARRARVLGRSDLAGKTGTTNDQKDAWFNGFNRSLVAVAWVGFDSSAPLGRGEVGGRAALPAWISFMKEALANVPEQPLEMPPGMVTVRINRTTGKRATTDEENAVFEVFRAEYAPEPLNATASTNPVPTGSELTHPTTDLF